MRALAALLCSAVTLLGVVTPARAAIITYYNDDDQDLAGQIDHDLSSDPGTQPNSPATLPSAFTNSIAGYNSFIAALGTNGFTYGIEDFETVTGATPVAASTDVMSSDAANWTLTFGSFPVTATLTANSGTTQLSNLASGTNAGRFPYSDTHYADAQLSSSGNTLVITFSLPVRAFGFFGTDFGDNANPAGTSQIRLTVGATPLSVPHRSEPAAPDFNGSLVFFGLISDTPFSSIEISNIGTNGYQDRIGFDNFIIAASPAAVPEPSAWMLGLVASLGGWSFVRRSMPTMRV